MVLAQSDKDFLRDLVDDVTAYHQLETTLENQIERTLFFNGVIPALMVVDIQREQQITYVNPAFEQLSGYKAAGLIGRHPRLLQRDDHQEQVLQSVRDAIRNHEPVVATLRNYRKDGSMFHNYMILAPVPVAEGDPVYYVSVHADASSGGQYSRMQQFSTLIENNPDPIYRKTRDGVYLYVNQAFAEVIGLPAKDIVGKTNYQLNIIPDLLPDLDAIRHKVFATGETQQIEFPFDVNDERCIFLSRLTPEFNADGVVETVLVVSRDVTERIRAERALRESEARLVKAQRIARVGSRERNLETGEVQWSDEFFAICGLNPETTIPSADLLQSLIHPDDYNRAEYIIEQAIDQNRPYLLEKRIIRPDREVRWIESRGDVLTDPETGVRRLVGTFRDITERKQAELSRIASENRAAALLHAIPDRVFRLDKNGTYLDFHGKSDELIDRHIDIRGLNIFDRLDEEIAREILETIHHALHTGSVQRIEQIIYFPAMQQDRVMEARIIPAGLDEVIAVLRDVTEERATERAIERREAQYKSMLAGMHEGVLLYDEHGTITMCNDAAVEITGHTRDELLQPLVHQPKMNLLTEDDQRITQETFPAQVTRKTGDPQTGVVMKFIHPQTQDMRWVKVNTRPLLDENTGKLYGVVTTFADITEERLAELERVNAAIERERIAILNTFIQMSSHEFRTPLAVIMTNLHMISRLSDDERVVNRLSRISKQVDRLNDLIEMQLLMTKLDSGIMMHHSQVNLDLLISQQVMVMNDILDDQNLQVVLDIHPDSLTVSADAGYLGEVIKQLLGNSIRYTPDGGTITIRAYREDAITLLEVEDNGVGISPEDMPFIFDRFWRRDKAHSEAGFGLGLALAKQIIALHEGEIDATSTTDHGTIITIRLP